MTAAMSAPADSTSSMFASVMPPMAHTGTDTAAFTARSVSVVAGRVSGLEPVGKSRPTET